MNEINDILRKLKRYSFDSKMGVSYLFSKKGIGKDFTFKYEQSKETPVPWHLETFVMLSIKASPEYNNANFNGKNVFQFYRMINSINSYPSLTDKTPYGAFKYISSIAMQQFEYQEPPKYRLYRYKFIFNYQDDVIDMKKIFTDFFECSYDDYVMVYLFLLVFVSSFSNDNVIKALKFLFDEYPIIIKKMSLDINKYIELLDKINPSVENYINCYCPSSSYPFIIKDNQTYLPLPHLLSKAFTSSLLYRLTEENNSLRSLIGKNVLESYAYHIIKESNVYSEVYREKIYIIERKQEARTVDVLAKEGDFYLFVDCKMYVPLSSLRQMNNEDYLEHTDRLAEYGSKMYLNITQHRKKYKGYNPFKEEIANISNDFFYGFIVVLEDSYIQRRLLYKEIAKKCNIIEESLEYEWLIHHIKIVDFYELERHCIHGVSIINTIKQTEDPYALVYTIKDKNNKTNSKFYDKVNESFNAAAALALKMVLKEQKKIENGYK